MRAGALSDRKIGAYVDEHCVSTWKRVGTFTAVQHNGRTVTRAGGNVAIYFCTPELEVVNAIAGPADKRTFLAEAKWAVETWKAASEKAGDDRDALLNIIKEAHQARVPRRAAGTRAVCEELECDGVVQLEALLEETQAARPCEKEQEEAETPRKPMCVPDSKPTPGTTDLLYRVEGEQHLAMRAAAIQTLVLNVGGGRNMHRYLAGQGLPKLDDVYKHIFERVLGERVTDKAVRTVDMGARMQRVHAQAVTRVATPTGEVEDLRKQVEQLQKQVEKLTKMLEERR